MRVFLRENHYVTRMFLLFAGDELLVPEYF